MAQITLPLEIIHQQISRFFHARDSLEDAHPHYGLILSLWIGPTLSRPSDLLYGSTSWPITIIDRILNSCNNLRSLYLVNLDQNNWFRIEDAIPQSLESLTMGPVHGPFRINEMKRKPRIHHFTSIQTFMRDDEIRDLVVSPHIRTLRRIWSSSGTRLYFLDQAECVRQSETLRVMELMFPCVDDHKLRALRDYLKNVTNDPRVVISTDHSGTWEDIVRAEFEMEQISYLSEQF
ncbi:hypothetical protein H0H92_008906 [Tricholoma furcatifolium]|nr:hypothetical protein H0H92_008906 [Tricholoma furcatifolium]